MNNGLPFVAFSISVLGALIIFSGGALALVAMDKKSPDNRLGEFLSYLAHCHWSKVYPQAISLFMRGLDNGIRRLFEEAAKEHFYNILFISLVFVFIPLAAAVNALMGGTPFLLQSYLWLVLLVVLLAVVSQLNQKNALTTFISGGVALMLCVGLLFAAPFYVLLSFTERLLHEPSHHAFLLSLLIAPFYYICASATMHLLEMLFVKNSMPERTVGQVFLRRFLAVLPVSFVMVFLALLLGQVAVGQAAPHRTVQLLLASIVFSSLSLPITMMTLKGINSGGRGRFILGFAICLLLTTGGSIALLYFSYLSTPKAVTLAESLNVLIGLNYNGEGFFLGHDFWVMHLPFLPILGALSLFVASILLKILTSVPGFVARPYFALSALLIIVGVSLFVFGRLLA